MKLPLPARVDLQLPPRGARRVAVLGALAVGGLVALLVPLFFAVMLIGMLRG